MQSSDIPVLVGDVNAELIWTVFDVQVAHVTDATRVKVQQLVSKQRVETPELYLAHL